jgi:hypothetical protein
MGINITKLIQLQIGLQMAYLVDAKTTLGSLSSSANAIMDLYNRFDYGAAAGAEVYPVKFLLIGARYNIGFANIYKDFSNITNPPAYVPSVDVKNNLFQIYAGIRF